MIASTFAGSVMVATGVTPATLTSIRSALERSPRLWLNVGFSPLPVQAAARHASRQTIDAPSLAAARGAVPGRETDLMATSDPGAHQGVGMREGLQSPADDGSARRRSRGSA